MMKTILTAAAIAATLTYPAFADPMSEDDFVACSQEQKDIYLPRLMDNPNNRFVQEFDQELFDVMLEVLWEQKENLARRADRQSVEEYITGKAIPQLEQGYESVTPLVAQVAVIACL